jgi:hypothetical protein
MPLYDVVRAQRPVRTTESCRMAVSIWQVVAPCHQGRAGPHVLRWQRFLAARIIILVLQGEMIYNAR